MKKALSILLALVMCLSLCACGGGETPNTNNNNSTQQQIENNSTTENNETTDDDTTDNNNTNTTNNELIKEWEEKLFNNVWYGKCHGRENETELEFVFYPDGSYGTNGERNETWIFEGFYEDGAEYMETAPIWQTTPDYALESGLYVTNNFTLGITKDGEYVLRTWNDYICYTQSQNQEN